MLQTVINIAGEISPTLGKTINKVAGKLDGVNMKAVAVGAAAGAAVLATGKAVVDAGKYLKDLGSQFNEVTKNIRIGTGATGEALESLLDDFDTVYKSVPTTMGRAGQAIADYNTRLGLTGDRLQDMSVKAIQVSDMLGDDLTTVIESSSQALTQWDIKSEKMGDAMDYIFKVSQSTGLGFSTLMSKLQSYGPQLQELGYTFEESAALIGQLEKAGTNTDEVLSAMKKSVSTFAKEGVSASKGLEIYCDKIKKAGTETEATAIASELFGTKAGSTLASAIRKGTLSVGKLTKELIGSSETISGAAEDTYDFTKRLQLFKQRAEVALKPLANTVFDSLNKVMPIAEKLMGKAVPVIEKVVDAAVPFVDKFVSGLVDMVDALIPIVEDLTGKLVSFARDGIGFVTDHADILLPIIGGLAAGFIAYKAATLACSIASKAAAVAEGIKTAVLATGATTVTAATIATWALNAAMSFLTSPITLVIAAVAALVAGGIALYKNWDKVKAKALELGGKLSEIWNKVKNSVGNMIEKIGQYFPVFGGYLSGLWKSVCDVVENIKGVFRGVIDFISNVFSGNWKGAWQSIIDIFGNLFGGIVNIAKTPINGVIGAINAVIESINKVGFKIPDWIPGIGGKEFSINIPLIPMLAKGGFTDGISIAGEAGTEAVISFDPAYRSENLSYWAEAGRLLGADYSDIATGNVSSGPYINMGGIKFAPQITIHGEAKKETIMEAIESEYPEFVDLLEEWFEERGITVYD